MSRPSNGISYKFTLSPRESEACLKLAEGKSFAQIGLEMGIAPRTARYHIARAKPKLGIWTMIGIVRHFLMLRIQVLEAQLEGYRNATSLERNTHNDQTVQGAIRGTN